MPASGGAVSGPRLARRASFGGAPASVYRQNRHGRRRVFGIFRDAHIAKPAGVSRIAVKVVTRETSKPSARARGSRACGNSSPVAMSAAPKAPPPRTRAMRSIFRAPSARPRHGRLLAGPAVDRCGPQATPATMPKEPCLPWQFRQHQHHRPMHRDCVRAGNRVRWQLVYSGNQPIRQFEAYAAPQHTQHRALNHQLPHQTPLRRAQSGAHGKLCLPDEAARNQQIGHIRAGNRAAPNPARQSAPRIPDEPAP